MTLNETNRNKTAVAWSFDGKESEQIVMNVPPGLKEISVSALRKLVNKWEDERVARRNFKKALREGKVMAYE